MRKASSVKDILIETAVAAMIFILTVIFVVYGKPLHALGGDIGDQAYAVFGGIGRSLKEGELPLWYPYLWGGVTGVGQPYCILMYPVSFFLELIFMNSDTQILSFKVMEVLYIIHMYILILGTKAMLQTIGFKRWIAFFTAIITMFSVPALWGYQWVILFVGFSWVPFFINSVIIVTKNEGHKSKLHTLLAGVILGFIGLGGTSHGILFLSLYIAIFYTTFVISNYKSKDKLISITKQYIWICAIGFAICSISIIPLMEFAGKSYRYVPEYGFTKSVNLAFEAFVKHSVGIEEIKNFFSISYGRIGLGTIGTMLFVLGLININKKEKEFEMYEEVTFNFAKGSFLFMLLTSVGIITPVLLYKIPFINAIRELDLYGKYTMIPASIIIASGLNFLEVSIVEIRKKRVDIIREKIALISIFIIFIISVVVEKNIVYTVMNSMFLLVCTGCVTEIGDKKSKKILLQCVIGIIAIVQFGSQFTLLNDHTISFSEATERVDNINLEMDKEFRKLDDEAGGNPYRVLQFGSVYPTNILAPLGRYDAIGYINPIDENSNFFHNGIDHIKRSVIENIKVFVTRSDTEPEVLEWMNLAIGEFEDVGIEMYSSYDSLEKEGTLIKINETKGVAWIAEKIKFYNDSTNDEELKYMINQSDFNPMNEAYINIDTIDEKNRSIDFNQNDKLDAVNIKYYKANGFALEVKNNAPAILVTSEDIYPGWKVYVDGQQETMIEVNGFKKGVVLSEPGIHYVEMIYRPSLFIFGMLLSIIGYLLMGIYMVKILLQARLKAH